MNILVVDDNKCTSMAIADYCQMSDIQCKEINDGQIGLFEIQRHEYDLIILDIAMPVYSGLDILNYLKKQGVYKRNIIILTGTNLKLKDFEAYKKVGVINVLYKPISLVSLDQMFNRICNKSCPV